MATIAQAAIVPTVPLATAAEYSVLGATTVTNTNATTLNDSLGLSPGTSITGFPPGQVVPPATTDISNAAAAQAQADLGVAYDNAAGRPVDQTTTADLTDVKLQGGVYHGPDTSPLSLTGTLTLDGANNPSSVFIFQTDSTLKTASSSTVSLINGALECNVFWQVGSSATLGSGSVFRGNILALTSITVERGVTVHGRALARNGAVTLNNDTFVKPTCAAAPGDTTTSSSVPTSTSSTLQPTTTSSTVAPTTTSSSVAPTTRSSSVAPTTRSSSVAPTTRSSSVAPTTTSSTVAPTTSTSAAARSTSTSTSTNATGLGTTVTTARINESAVDLTAASRLTPAVVGVPRTGGAPLPDPELPWQGALALTLSVGSGTACVIVSRRAQARGAPPSGR